MVACPMRSVFFISDGTGITAETLGHSLLAQFDDLEIRQARRPFVDTVEKALDCVEQLNACRARDGVRSIVFATVVDPEVRRTLDAADAFIVDLFERFLEPLAGELDRRPTHNVGRFQHVAQSQAYLSRIEAINFTLAHDDGVTDRDLEQADVILVGVSRSGKTPTSIYLAMQFAVRAANYPLIPEDFERNHLPGALEAHRTKLFGLSIDPLRLHQIRTERRPNSRYAALDNCIYEVTAAQRLMRREGVRWLDSTTKSIEEIAITILQTVQIERPGF
ncbi:MAG: kinase/pyrophosphorylase [Rhodocyclaceae bacterium]|nr:kinase/pyrophosphorylase [Rhodocyclaceae bacterium]